MANRFFGRGGWEYVDGVPHQRWHLFIGRYHRLFHTRRGIRRSAVAPDPPIIRAIGGNRWTVAYWRWPHFNFYVRVGSQSVFWRQP
jgi:hypothetical protein